MSRDRGSRRKSKLVERRRRRTPEVARQELLDAAERVFTEFHPDQVGLKQVAREAGVSHALITHYFGTYGGVIERGPEPPPGGGGGRNFAEAPGGGRPAGAKG